MQLTHLWRVFLMPDVKLRNALISMKWLEKIPLGPLALAALFMALAPLQPQPHLWEKLQMLWAGSLTRPIDIFDLLWHAALPLLLVAKVIQMKKTTSAREETGQTKAE